jgi:hypothetical protein
MTSPTANQRRLSVTQTATVHSRFTKGAALHIMPFTTTPHARRDQQKWTKNAPFALKVAAAAAVLLNLAAATISAMPMPV